MLSVGTLVIIISVLTEIYVYTTDTLHFSMAKHRLNFFMSSHLAHLLKKLMRDYAVAASLASAK